jgi:hypothetical protein
MLSSHYKFLLRLGLSETTEKVAGLKTLFSFKPTEMIWRESLNLLNKMLPQDKKLPYQWDFKHQLKQESTVHSLDLFMVRIIDLDRKFGVTSLSKKMKIWKKWFNHLFQLRDQNLKIHYKRAKKRNHLCAMIMILQSSNHT